MAVTFLPFFPLNLVAYPTQALHLHIFEPRYRDLVHDCIAENRTFGIPAFINAELPGFGTEMEITELSRTYDDGRMDIKTRGIRVFRMLSFENPWVDKLYAGGEVVFLDNTSLHLGTSSLLLKLLHQLFEILKVTFEYDSAKQPFSFQISHKIGLSLDQQYALLTITDEQERQDFLIKHLNKAIPIMIEMERAKELIKLNGHFKNLDPLKL